MQSHSRAHHSLHPHWDPANVTITILVTLLFLVFLFLFLTLAATPALGQNHVPPTAAQAAKMPQFASRLAHPIRMGRPGVPGAPGFGAPGWRPENASRLPLQQRATYRNPNDAHKRYGRSGPLDSGEIYNNGPINGTVDAWTINFGFIVSDTFTSQGSSTPNALKFAAWLFPGDILETAEVSITSSEFGGTTYFDGVVNFTQSGCTSNQFGFDVCLESGTFPDVQLNSGTYWINLQNAVVNTGDPVYWDENSGPSNASQNSVGTIPSESFTVLGGSSTTTSNFYTNWDCPHDDQSWREVHGLPFTPQPPPGVAEDASGNLYGSAPGGFFGQGMLYKLAENMGQWIFSSLASFTGGDNGSSPGTVLVGPDGNLYGSASGGKQNCGNGGTSYCGVIFKSSPSPVPCPSASCGGSERSIYEFTGNTDAWGGTVAAFDSAGNLYGFSGGGGAYGQGAIFQLSRSGNVWTETVIHNFTGNSDGGYPTSLLVGRDGFLYGTAWGPGYGSVFRLVPSGNTWTESLLYVFTNNGDVDGASPGGLVQDNAGTLFGFSVCQNSVVSLDCGGGFPGDYYGLVFRLSPSPSHAKWDLGIIYNNVYECENSNTIHALALGSDGLYAAQGGVDAWCGPVGCYSYYCGQVVAVGEGGGTSVINGNADIFYNLTSDSHGRVFGTVSECGGIGTPWRDKGMVWEYSP